MDHSNEEKSGTAQFVLTAVLLCAAIVLGGSTRGVLADSLVQVLALLLVAMLLWPDPRRLVPAGTAWLPLLVLLIPLLACLPMPGGLWSTLGARAPLAGELASVQVRPDAHVGLIAYAAERALWSLLPAAALYLSVLRLSLARQKQLLALLFAFALIGVILGFAQLADGPDSALRLHRPTNTVSAVGFFANRNHFASFLGMVLPLVLAAAAWYAGERAAGKRINPLVIVGLIGLAVVLILGVALTGSRAGLGLGMLSLLLAIPLIFSLRHRRGSKRVLAIIATVGIALTVQFALFGIMQKLSVDPLTDSRWTMNQLALPAAQDQGALGAGPGTFRQIYQPYEARARPNPLIVAHAHNDYLEVWLESGWPGLAAIALMLAYVAWFGIAVWRQDDGPGRLTARACTIALLLVLVHSALDYPLRTTSNQVVFALLLAIVVRVAGSARETRVAPVPATAA
ncbi:O-antigen ligase family protein [Arenimonas oryziterrae]|uniref:O-antigen ligase-related domain-containing protein n=1 Tax=Arenimonas oryziterrae DSM 21050 = YC6267 TaxID=1121015 RepID=A0A091AXN9_9GAMM|nr:O-antigen ligase family protein [Arenimonas oryziterrae]KFN45088.1 hypothetical protein N789_03435 [Arenimonas oryziterrae DSM 21050 = YC6267]